MLGNGFIVLILFLYHEGFYLLPERMVVIPGVFRLSDAFFFILPFFSFTIPRTFSRYREESLLVLSFILLMILSSLMGYIFFPQSYLDSLLNIRSNFFWLSFFIYIPLIRNLDRAEKLIKLLTFIFGAYLIILLITKYFPELGIINYPERFYSIKGATKRFGEYRLFFPYGNIFIMLYFIVLARLIHENTKETFLRKSFRLAFAMIVIYATLATYTRAVIFPLLVVTAFSLFTSRRRFLKVLAIAAAIPLVSFQLLNLALYEDKESFIEETRLGKLIFRAGDLKVEGGRKFQASVYLAQFMRSPFTGVGNFAVRRFAKFKVGGVLASYKMYGFFNTSDLGYPKILAENGLLGIAWLIWWFSYFFRRGRQTLAEAVSLGNMPLVENISRGFLYFTMYLLISGVTLGHWVHPNGVTILPLALTIMAILRVSVNEAKASSDKATTLRTVY